MTWLVEDSPYWTCHSCGKPGIYKPAEDCDENKHKRYYRKRLVRPT